MRSDTKGFVLRHTRPVLAGRIATAGLAPVRQETMDFSSVHNIHDIAARS